MKRFSIALLAIAVALVMALPAGADPPHKDKPGKPPETLIGMTCEKAGLASLDRVTGSAFELTVTGREVACVDVVGPAGTPFGTWTVNVVAAEGVRRVTIRVQDSVAPGDLCGDDMITGVLNENDSPTLSGIPEATLNACGDEYEDEDEALAFLVFGQKGTFTINVTLPTTP